MLLLAKIFLDKSSTKFFVGNLNNFPTSCFRR